MARLAPICGGSSAVEVASLLSDPEPVSSADLNLNSHITLAEWLDETGAQLGVVHASRPHYGVDDFLSAMKFSADGEAFLRNAAMRI